MPHSRLVIGNKGGQINSSEFYDALRDNSASTKPECSQGDQENVFSRFDRIQQKLFVLGTPGLASV